VTNAYRWVQWNRHKRVYDLWVAGSCAAFLAVFVGVTMATHRPPNDVSPPIILIRAFGVLAIALLHVILLIGPLSRFTDRLAPLLYNRRHLGVTMFLAALAHGALSILFYGGFGVRDPVSAMLRTPGSFASVSGFPFEILGFVALLILFVMAATSHDFWLANLGPRLWKSLHMLVYAAYGLVVMHVALGALQSEPAPVYAWLLGGGVAAVAVAHLAAGLKERRRDASPARALSGWIEVKRARQLEDGAGLVVVCPGGERVAVFRDGDAFSAMSNVCAHQAGPLGEGRIIDGCVTCPWHGYQYDPASGQSPPPHTEKIPTYELRVEGDRLMLSLEARAPGTPIEPARFGGRSAS